MTKQVGLSASWMAPLAYSPRRVLLIDDHSLLREGLRRLLSTEPDLEVIGEAATPAHGVTLAGVLQPDLVLMDINFPVGSGLDVIGLLRQTCPASRIVVLSVHANPHCIDTALRLGAHAYVRKDACFKELLVALRDGAPPPPAARAKRAITRRELQVLLAVARGMTSKQIAAQLSRSVKTVDKHRASMMRKLELDDAGAVTRYALAHGYLSPLTSESQ